MEKISITAIVPCYNREKTIITCIDSILKQMEYNDEIIIVDDASNDNTVEIINKNYKDNKQVKLVKNKINLGVSYARNKAIEMLKTDLVTFIDSDDYISDGYFNFVRTQFKKNNIDVIVSGLSYIDKVLNLKKDLLPNDIEGTLKEKILNLDEQGLLSSCCNKVYKVEIVKKNNLLFNTDAIIMEDFEFNLKYLEYIKDIIIYQKSWYNYVYYGNVSASSKYQETLYSRYREIKNMRLLFYPKSKEKEVFELNTKFLLLCLNNLYKKNNLTSKQRRKILQKIIYSNDFKRWKKYCNKKGIFEKIIYYTTLSNNPFVADVILKMMHDLKNSSTFINKKFRNLNKK